VGCCSEWIVGRSASRMVLWMFMLNRTMNNKRLYQSELWLFIAMIN